MYAIYALISVWIWHIDYEWYARHIVGLSYINTHTDYFSHIHRQNNHLLNLMKKNTQKSKIGNESHINKNTENKKLPGILLN